MRCCHSHQRREGQRQVGRPPCEGQQEERRRSCCAGHGDPEEVVANTGAPDRTERSPPALTRRYLPAGSRSHPGGIDVLLERQPRRGRPVRRVVHDPVPRRTGHEPNGRSAGRHGRSLGRAPGVGPARSAILAAARGLPDRRDARSGRENELRGRETIHYVNNSPETPAVSLDARRAEHLRAEQRHQRSSISRRSSFSAPRSTSPARDSTARLDARVGCRWRARRRSRRSYGTTMRVDLARPLAPGRDVDIEIVWHFNVPTTGAGRMGHDGPLYEIAQWYPRMAVYDDVRGWNHEPYIGAGEFYLEYGSFDVDAHRARDYVVAATGELANPEQVLTASAAGAAGAARASPTPRSRSSRADEAGDPSTHPARRTAGDADLALHRRQRARLRLRGGAQTSAGTRAATRASSSRRSTARRRQVARGEPDGPRGDQVLQRAVVSAIPTRTRRRSKGRSRAWSTRCSPSAQQPDRAKTSSG